MGAVGVTAGTHCYTTSVLRRHGALAKLANPVHPRRCRDARSADDGHRDKAAEDFSWLSESAIGTSGGYPRVRSHGDFT
jgi:hypothetical protein